MPLTLGILEMGARGDGIAERDGERYFVPFSLPGEVVEAEPTDKRGEGIAVPLRRCGQFPPLAGHLLTVGEETGKLDEMFQRMADIYENDTKVSIRRFTSLFEPLVILVMGIIVGVMILSMLLAITSINDTRVLYVEPAKWVAKLRATKTGDAPLLLKTEMSAGHGGVSGRYEKWREVAFEFAWVLATSGAYRP